MEDKNVIKFTEADLRKSHKFTNRLGKPLVILPPDGHVFSWDDENGYLVCVKTKKEL